VAEDDRRSTPAQLAELLDFLDPIEEDIRRVKLALSGAASVPAPPDAAASPASPPAAGPAREPSLARG